MNTEAKKNVQSLLPLTLTPHRESNENNQSATNRDIETAQTEDPVLFNPDQDYYHGSTSMRASTVSIILAEIALGIFAPVWTMYVSPYFEEFTIGALETLLPLGFFSLWCIILVSFGIDWVMSQKAVIRCPQKGWLLAFLQFLNISVFIVFISVLAITIPC